MCYSAWDAVVAGLQVLTKSMALRVGGVMENHNEKAIQVNPPRPRLLFSLKQLPVVLDLCSGLMSGWTLGRTHLQYVSESVPKKKSVSITYFSRPRTLCPRH